MGYSPTSNNFLNISPEDFHAGFSIRIVGRLELKLGHSWNQEMENDHIWNRTAVKLDILLNTQKEIFIEIVSLLQLIK